MIEVVSGVMIRDGRVFLTQQSADKSYPMLWGNPGGKVEGGEGPRAALLRELEEELSTWADPSKAPPDPVPESFFTVAEEPFFATSFSRGEVDGCDDAVTVSFYLVDLFEGVWVVGAEGQGSGWFSIAGMRYLQMLPGNEQARSLVEREIVRDGAKKR
jgi:8-oxo-dGTP diphosphatase